MRGFLCTWGVSGGIFLGYVVAPQSDSGTGETNLQFLQVMLIKCFRDIHKASCAIAASKQNTMHMRTSLQRLLMLEIHSAHQSVANSCQFETNSRHGLTYTGKVQFGHRVNTLQSVCMCQAVNKKDLLNQVVSPFARWLVKIVQQHSS